MYILLLEIFWLCFSDTFSFNWQILQEFTATYFKRQSCLVSDMIDNLHSSVAMLSQAQTVIKYESKHLKYFKIKKKESYKTK